MARMSHQLESLSKHDTYLMLKSRMQIRILTYASELKLATDENANPKTEQKQIMIGVCRSSHAPTFSCYFYCKY